MEDHWGSPEREKEVTVQPRAVADLQIRLPGVGGLVGFEGGMGWDGEGRGGDGPRKPLPPQTTMRFLDIGFGSCGEGRSC